MGEVVATRDAGACIFSDERVFLHIECVLVHICCDKFWRQHLWRSYSLKKVYQYIPMHTFQDPSMDLTTPSTPTPPELGGKYLRSIVYSNGSFEYIPRMAVERRIPTKKKTAQGGGCCQGSQTVLRGARARAEDARFPHVSLSIFVLWDLWAAPNGSAHALHCNTLQHTATYCNTRTTDSCPAQVRSGNGNAPHQNVSACQPRETTPCLLAWAAAPWSQLCSVLISMYIYAWKLIDTHIHVRVYM